MSTVNPPSSERPPEPANRPATPPTTDPDPIHDIPWSIPPEIRAAQAAFERDLPQLLKERPGQWVAYYGDKPIHFAKDKTALCLECERLGYEEYLTRCIEPWPEFDYISAF
jgi:hypothetical protein